MLAVLSFLMVLAAAVLTVGSVFLFSFACFLLIAIVTFVLMEMRHSVTSESTHAQDPRASAGLPPNRRMAHNLLAIAPALMLLIMAGSFVIFFFLPRVSSRYLSAYTPTSDVSTGFTDRVQLGRIGQIQQSSAVVMHIEIQNDTQGAYDLKWRGVALSSFDGKAWSNGFEQTPLHTLWNGSYMLGPSSGPHAPSSPSTSPSALRRSIRYHVLMEPLGTNVFFWRTGPRACREISEPSAPTPEAPSTDLDPDHPINRYEGVSQLPDVDSDELRLSPNVAPADMDRYAAAPPLDDRIPQLAREITANAPSNYEKAIAVEHYLSTRFGYTLELPRTLAPDPLANFLFERKHGHCEYFASSMAVMLRTLGIPSRMVTGFHGGEFNDLTGQYVIRASDAHSWVEAYFPGSGWISFDPTPAGSVPPRTGWSRMRLYVDAAASFWREWVINYDVGHQRTLGKDAATNTRRFFDEARRWIGRQHRAMLRAARRTHQNFARFPVPWLSGLIGFATLLLLALNLPRMIRGLRALSLRSHPERAPREAAALWYERMVARLARLGWRKSPSQTPRDFVAAIQEEALQKKVATFTSAYESARFGRSVDDAQRLPDLFQRIATPESDEESDPENAEHAAVG